MRPFNNRPQTSISHCKFNPVPKFLLPKVRTLFEESELLPWSKNDSAVAVTTGLDGSIYLAGSTDGNLDGNTNSGIFLMKFNSDGQKQ